MCVLTICLLKSARFTLKPHFIPLVFIFFCFLFTVLPRCMPAISLFTLEDDDEEVTLFPVVEVSLDGTLKNPSSYSAVDFSIYSSFLSVSKM